MMKLSFQLVLCFLFLPAAFIQAQQADDLSEGVVIVVNERDPDSRRIGEHYAEKRGIPRENIIALDAPTAETITRRQYIDLIRNPLQQELFEGGWLTGLPSSLKDSEGRFRSMIDGHRIAYLVLCRGLPLRVKHDAAGVTPETEQAIQKEFLTSAASVDSELALIIAPLPSMAFIQNPLFGKKTPGAGDLMKVLKVARLDGPTASDAMALVDHALEAERLGMRGRTYVDLAGPHPDGTTWLEATARQIRALGFDLQLHEPKGTFPISARFDAPVLYFGWYANDVSGPFLLDGFRFPPGAIAFHIHSFSARTLESASVGWVGPFVARGATVTLGNVYEPYLQFSHRPNLFFDWVKNGGNAGDAAAYAIAVLSWQGVFVGDPLYRPFARSLEEQLAADREGEENGLGAYAVIRQMNLSIANGRRKEAIEEGLAALEGQPSLALALAVAKAQVEEGERRRAVRTLGMAGDIQSFAPMEVMLAKEAADFLGTLNEHRAALEVYELILKERGLSPELKRALLPDGLLLARRLNRRSLVRDWRDALSSLQPQGK